MRRREGGYRPEEKKVGTLGSSVQTLSAPPLLEPGEEPLTLW